MPNVSPWQAAALVLALVLIAVGVTHVNASISA